MTNKNQSVTQLYDNIHHVIFEIILVTGTREFNVQLSKTISLVLTINDSERINDILLRF